MKTQEELQYKLFKQTTEVENALIKLDKASMLLIHWEHEYVFIDRPNPREAVAAGASVGGDGEMSIKAEQSCKWFYEYPQIVGFIDIVHDYVCESKKLLEMITMSD